MNLLLFGVVLFLCSGVFTQTDPARGTSDEYESTTYGHYVAGISNYAERGTVILPKCCDYGYSVGLGTCNKTMVKFQPKFDVHNHNDTAFDDVPIDPSLITFETFVHNPCSGKKFPLSPDEQPKILLNGSLLLAGMGEYDGILGHQQFCIDNIFDDSDPTDSPQDTTVYAFVCIKEQIEGYPQWVFSAYITLITISALLFTSSAVFFYRQDVQGVHKKSFIAYAISMSGVYLIIILMQFISGGCKVFGLALQFFIILSYAWLAILCFDLAWRIHHYNVKENTNRFVSYIGSSISYATLFLIISVAHHLTPDIPGSFFKPQFRKTICSNFDGEQRTSIFFTAIILTLAMSLLSLCYSLIKMNQNRYRNTSDGEYQWKRVSKKFRYMYGRKLIIFVTMIIWFFDTFSDRFPLSSTMSIIILLIQAFHGFIIVPLFTMKAIRKVIDINKKPRIENLQDLMEVSKNYQRAE